MDAKAEARAELQREREAGIWAEGEGAEPVPEDDTVPATTDGSGEGEQ
jgi:GTP-binding protein